jgi:NADPH-dependent glutamate synthase beta subunit-like oxidoreductase/coenzyme F420-reducing hydrogenase delta subunit
MPEPSAAGNIYAPCIAACPVHTDTRKLSELVTQGEYEQALELLLEANPFSSVCGRICHHPCEQNCRRTKVDAPVGLMKLKRFVIEATRDYRLSRGEKFRTVHRKKKKDKKIAVIGSGPSGLTAACDLVKMGYPVTVFERSHTSGGLLGNAIPRYRLPYSVVKEDIEDILSIGVELKTGLEIGNDYKLDELLSQGFQAVLLATGLSESRTLNIPGIDSEGILLALPFLRTVLAPKPPTLGKRVVVIGGGNVAIDVARSARRLGAEKVTIFCLESREQMPAWKWEIEETVEEGISIMDSWGPKSVFSEDGAVKGLELKRCVRVFDENGRFDPRFDDSDTATLMADNAIIAIGQRGDLTCIQGSDLQVNPGERLVCDPQTLATSRQNVFACGELLIGPSSSVESVYDGHRAAKAIAHYLEKGELLRQPPMELTTLESLPDETADKIRKLSPVSIELVPPETRLKDFTEIERGFTEGEALAEAKRCLACTTGALADEEKCAACLNCVRICPFDVATVEKTAVMPEEKCQACGLCAAECPAAAIALKRFGTNKMKEQLQDVFSGLAGDRSTRPLIISYCCLFEVTSRNFITEKSENYRKYGVHRILIPCIARLSVVDILSPFELGADGLTVIGCSEDSCLYPTAEEKLLGRIRHAKKVLEEVGVEGERIDYWKTRGSAEVSWTSFWEISRRKVNLLKNGGL